MWRLLLFVVLLHLTRCDPRIGQGKQNDKSLDIRLAVPGEPGADYPTLGNIPRTSFSCSGKEPGYYADYETNCQAFRVCTRGTTFGFQSFLCPNGTLFNQAVFVCDWWMNVNCQKTPEPIIKNAEKFANIQLGPQLMQDIKKMITYPMLNHYDKSILKSQPIVMQNYFPPKGQMPIVNSISNNFRSTTHNDIFQQKRNIVQSRDFNNDIAFAASTPSSQYIPVSFNGQKSPRDDAEVFQRQSNTLPLQGQAHKSVAQNTNNLRSGKLIMDVYSGKIVQSNPNVALSSSSPFQRNVQYTNNAQYIPPYQNLMSYPQSARLQSNPQQSNYMASKEFAKYVPSQYPRFSPEIFSSGVSNEAKQNLVSSNVTPSPIIAKSLTLDKVVHSKPGAPLSRITFKTWLVKPSRSKFISPSRYYAPSPDNSFEPVKLKSMLFSNTQPQSAKISIDPNAQSPYTYNAQPYKYAKPLSENIVQSNPYIYDKPTAAPQRVIQAGSYVYNKPTPLPQRVTQAGPYVYNKPTAASQRVAEAEPYVYSKPTATPQRVTQAGSYVYNKPTAAPKRVTEAEPYVYNIPTPSPRPVIIKLTSPKPTLSDRLYLPPSSIVPTRPTRLYVPPVTTYKPAAKIYLPPSSSSQPIVLSNQYLPPQNEKLQASPSTAKPFFTNDDSNTDSPSFTLTKHSRINANHNNLTFADILTKEKLDITVNDIVKATNKILDKTNNQKSSQYKLDENYLPPNSNDSGESLTPASPTNPETSAKIVQSLSTELEPPVESPNNSNENNNPIAKLPYYLDPTNPTIERTVSLKISIPEKVANSLFSNKSSKLDTLEILNTGSTNYLVLSNNQIKTTNPTTFIPIAKLVEDKQSNYSDSQGLVYKILQDSLKAAKAYNNIAQHSVLSTKVPTLNENEENYSRVINQISRLTAQQFSENNAKFQNNAQEQLISRGPFNEFDYSFDVDTPQQTEQQNSLPMELTNNIYSGQFYQLPVPEVTNHINRAKLQERDVNAGFRSELEQSQSFQSENNHDSNIEIIQSQAVSLPATLQQEEQSINQQDINTNALIHSLLNAGNGISAQVQDKIVGTIPHPSLHNKLVTYQNDKSYFVVTHNNFLDQTSTPVNPRNANLVQNNNTDIVTYQFVPSVSYQLTDEKDQEDILNTLHLTQYGQPKKLSKSERLTQDVDLQIEHPSPLYSGPSSYSAPQASVGSLETTQKNNQAPRIEKLETTPTFDDEYD